MPLITIKTDQNTRRNFSQEVADQVLFNARAIVARAFGNTPIEEIEAHWLVLDTIQNGPTVGIEVQFSVGPGDGYTKATPHMTEELLALLSTYNWGIPKATGSVWILPQHAGQWQMGNLTQVLNDG